MDRREFLKTGITACAGGMFLGCCKCFAVEGEPFKYLRGDKLPTEIKLDVCTLCQLACPLCDSAMNPNSYIGKGYTTFENFRKFVDKNPGIKSMEISGKGEIFLNPDLPQIIEYAAKKGIRLTAYGGTNFNTVSDECMEALCKYNNFGMMTLSIDGASQETYKQYRIGGDFDTVINNVKRLNACKAKHKSNFPIARWQYIVFKHNKHEIAKAKLIAKELNIDIFFRHSWDEWQEEAAFSPIKVNDPVIEKELPKFHEQPRRKHFCFNLWDRPMINWDGKIVGCCANFYGTFGKDAFDKTVREILNEPKILYAKKMLTGQAPPRDDIPCSKCWYYIWYLDEPKEYIERGKA